MANFDNGRLNSSIGVDFDFSVNDKISNVLRNIEDQLGKLQQQAQKAGKTIDAGVQGNVDKLKILGQAYRDQKDVIDNFSKRFAELNAEQERYRQLANSTHSEKYAAKFKEITKEIRELRSNGGLEALSKELGDIEKDFNETANAIVKDLDKLSKGGEKGSKSKSSGLLSRLGFDKQGAEAFKANISAIKNTILGKNGLQGALSAAAGAIGGLVGGLTNRAVYAAINILNSAIRKGVQAVLDWVNSWGELRRAIKEGVGVAATEATKEILALNELNDALSKAQRNTSEWVSIRNEIVQKYGQYNKYLGEEINLTGSLASSYTQLSNAIVQASIARQRDKLIEERISKNEPKLQSKYSNLYDYIYKAYSGFMGTALNGGALSTEEVQSKTSELVRKVITEITANGKLSDETYKTLSLLETNQSRGILDLFTGGTGLRGIQRIIKAQNKEIGKIDAIYGTDNFGDKSADYSVQQQQDNARKTQLDKLRDFGEDQVKLERDIQHKRIAAMQEGYAKTMATLNLNYQRELDGRMDWMRRYSDQQAEAIKQNYLMLHPDKGESAFNSQWARDAMTAIALGSGTNSANAPEVNEAIAFLQSSGAMSANNAWDKYSAALRAEYNRQVNEANFAEKQRLANSYGNEDQRYKALEESIDREISLIKDKGVRKAAEARKELSLAEFSYNEAAKYGNTSQVRDALEKMLNEELDTIDAKYKDIKEAMNRVRLAEFDENAVEQFGTPQQRREARAKKLRDEANLWKGKNGGIKNEETGLFEMSNKDDEARINGYVEFEIAKINWEEALNIGTYEEKVKYAEEYWKTAIKNMGRASKESILAPLLSQFDDAITKIAEIKKNLQVTEASLKGAFEGGLINEKDYKRYLSQARKTAQDEIDALNSRNNEVYSKIFSDMRGKTASQLREAAELARQEVAKLTKDGKASTKEVTDLIQRVNELELAADEVDFGGWETGLMAVIRKFSELSKLEEDYQLKKAKYDSLVAQNAPQQQITQAKTDMENAQALIQASKSSLIKTSSVTAANAFASALGKAAQSMKQIAEATGNANLEGTADQLNYVSNLISSTAQGFAQGGLFGGIISFFTSGVLGIFDQLIEDYTEAEIKADQLAKDAERFQRAMTLASLEVREADYTNAFGENIVAEIAAQAKVLTDATKEYEKAMHDLFWGGNWVNRDRGPSSYPDYLKKRYTDIGIWDKENDDFDIEALELYLQTATSITEEEKEQLSNILKIKKAQEEAQKAIEKYLETLTNNAAESAADKILDNFLRTGDALANMNDLVQDFARNLAKSQIASKLMEEVFNDEAQETLKNLILDNKTSEAIEYYKELMERASEVGAGYTEFLNGLGIEQDRTAQNAGFAAMSQDSADELNGRFAVLQTHTYDIRAAVQSIQEQNNRLIEGTSLILLEVQGIHSDTGDIRESLSDVRGDVYDLRKSVDRIVDSGVRMLA